MTSEQDNGQCFVAVDPSCFAPGFEGRMQDLMGHVRKMEPAKEGDKVLVRHPVMIQMFISCEKHSEDCTYTATMDGTGVKCNVYFWFSATSIKLTRLYRI